MSDFEKVFILFDGGDDLRLPCVTSINPRLSSDVTTSPIEPPKEYGDARRTDVSDHIKVNPRTLSLTLFVSELAGQEELEAYDPFFVGDHIKIRERLEQAHDKGELLHLDLGADKGLYPNMAILEVPPEWTAGQGKSLNLTLQLQQLNFTVTKTKRIKPAVERVDIAGREAEIVESKIFEQGANGTNKGQILAKPVRGEGRITDQVFRATGSPSGETGDWVRGAADAAGAIAP